MQLLAPLHYLRQAMNASTDVLTGGLGDILPTNPDVIVLADVARLTQTEQDGVLDWLDEGGLLLRFAGPKLAASDIGRGAVVAIRQPEIVRPYLSRQGMPGEVRLIKRVAATGGDTVCSDGRWLIAPMRVRNAKCSS